MVAALILVISSAMLAQFVIFFWRANMLAIAAQPLSGSLNDAQNDALNALNLCDFQSLAAISKLCPGVTISPAKLWPVRGYYRALRSLSRFSATMPQVKAWALQEMAFCTRYLVISIEHCLDSNQAYVANLQSY